MNVQPLMPEVDFAADPMYDLEARLATLMEDGKRIAPIKWKGETAWVVLRYKDVFDGLSDDEKIPAAPEYLRNWDTQGAQPLKDRGAHHRVTHTLLESPFKIGKVRAMVEKMLVPLADRLIDEFGDGREVDLIKDYTRRYTFLVMSTLLGVSVDDEERLLQLVYALLQGGSIVGADTPENRRRAALVAVAEMNEFLRPIVEDRRKTPRDDIISYLLAAEIDGQPLSETVLFDYIRFLYPAGAETTHLVMGRMMNNILSDLSVRDRLVANPADRAAAVEEALRFSPGSNLIPRTLERDTEVCDVTIPAGSTVLFSVTSGNRDPAVFPEPEQFSIDQKRKQLLSFGIGPHFCIGSHLAKAELAVSLGRLLDRLPGLRLKEQAPPAMGTVFRWIPSLHVRFDTVNPAP